MDGGSRDDFKGRMKDLNASDKFEVASSAYSDVAAIKLLLSIHNRRIKRDLMRSIKTTEEHIKP